MAAKYDPGPEVRAQIVADYARGLGGVAIGAKNGVSIVPILRLLREEGATIRRPALDLTRTC